MNEYLDKKTESRLIALGNKKYYRTLALTVGWIALVVVLWLAVMLVSELSFATLPYYIPLVLCALPFFPFSAHKVLFQKTFYATVDYTVNTTQFQQLKEAYVHDRPDTVEVLEVKFKKDDGKLLNLVWRKKSYVMEGLHYNSGDRVIFVRGLKYPFKFPADASVERTCAVCGRTVGIGDRVCKRCGFDLAGGSER